MLVCYILYISLYILSVGQNVQTNLIHEPELFGFDEFQDIIGCDYNLKIISLRFHLVKA